MKPLSHFVCLSCTWLVSLSIAFAQGFPQAMDYVMQMQNSVQSNSNPGRASEIHREIERSTVSVNTIGMALRVPLLSQETRLDIAGATGKANYSGLPQFDHNPSFLDANLHWKAGDLFNGKFGYEYNRRRYESDQIWPESDVVSTRRLSAEARFNVSEDIALPIVKLYDEKANYNDTLNRQLFDYSEKGWEIAAKYQSVTGSSVTVGVKESRTTYPLRYQLNRNNLDDGYEDRELFAEVYWQYSVKTGLYTRLGWLNRKYDTFSDRNTRLLDLDTQLIWQYSPKTTLRAGLWQRPYNNDEDLNIQYSTLRGFGLSAQWLPTPKLGVSFSGTYEQQKDTRLTGDLTNSTRLRVGPRLTWQASPNLRVIFDGYHARKQGDLPSNRYQQNVVRLGIVVQTDNGNDSLAELLNPRECRWMHIETALCP